MIQQEKNIKKPLISIITDCYESLSNLFHTIDSVLIQDYENIEYIIADDGTKDFPIDKVKRYIEDKKSNIKFLKVYTNTSNLKTVRNYNIALKKAKGKYIFGLSCDDIFADASVIRKIVLRMESNNYDIMLCKRLLCDTEYHVLGSVPDDNVIPKLLKCNTPMVQYRGFINNHLYGVGSGASLVIKNDIYKKYNYYDEKYILLEDAPFLANLFRNGEYANYNFEFPYIYHMSGGISTRPYSVEGINRIYLEDVGRYYNEQVPYIKNRLKISEKIRFYYYKDFQLKLKPSKFVHLLFMPVIIYDKIINHLKR